VRILLDVDGVLGDFVSGARQWVNEHHGLTFVDEQITDYDLMTSFGLSSGGWPPFIDWLSITRFCLKMPIYPGAVEFVDDLRKLGEVIAVTSPFVGVDHWESDRRRWLEQHFAIGHGDLVFCKRKELVRGDLLIDDKPENVEAFAKHPGQTGVLFTRPWNATHSGGWHMRAEDYANALTVARFWGDSAGFPARAVAT
jgi:5'-nucleotidase